MDLNQIYYDALKGNCFLFLGAGFSYEATNAAGERFPSADKLARLLQKQLSFEEEHPQLKQVSEDYIDDYGKEALFKIISEIFRVKSTKVDYSVLTKMKWRRFYTTNYDDLIEQTFRNEKVNIHSLLINDEPSLMIPGEVSCIHLNGFVEKMELSKFDSEFKLTETSYLTQMFTNSKWKTVFNADLRECDRVFFIGYSLYDLDIEKILVENPDIRRKCIFITEEKPSPSLEKKLTKYGSILKIGIAGFLNGLAESISVWGDIKQGFRYENVQRYESVIPDSNTTTKDIISLFLYGSEKQSAIKDCVLSGNSDYYIFRNKIKELEHDLKKHSCVIVHSKLANGKSMFCLGAMEYLTSLGYTVYSLSDSKNITSDEIENLKKEKKPVLIIENYHRYIPTLKLLGAMNTDNIKILLTCRTELQEIYVENLDDLGWSSFEVDVNYLSKDELTAMINIMSSNGLFGDRSNLNEKKKFDYLTNNCRREISLILADILKAPQITKRINELLSKVQKDSELEECLLACSIASYLGYEFDSIDIQTLTSARGIDKVKYLKDENTSQILEKNSQGLVVLKNPVLAKYILSAKVETDPKEFLRFLVEFYGKLNKYSTYERKYYDLMKDINVFSNQLKLFGEGNCATINDFYDRVRLYSDNSRNHHFWLQFAIAKLSIKEHADAKTYIETTISLARDRRYNFDWVNCQYARLVIETAHLVDSTEEIIERLRFAASLIINQNNRHYPFRVACSFVYYERENQSTIDLETKKAIAEILRQFDAKYFKTISELRNKEHPVMLNFKSTIARFFKNNPSL
ncbi:hypothetical protein HMPREF9693_04456 [Klebsiella oxytoca 10-5249]|uniref:SIR2 family protein n=1 Tax=Klebsiella oxytoca TaxID=571 RepID=UPI00066CCBA2|nr:SIR2 family protein [Klebsiella oxytoca]KMV94425.1 hypothetical protein HMPREF9693_04456 [Klebsiella oxytoca 10-5249]